MARNRKRNESLVRWREVIRKIAKEGFLKKDGVSQRFVERLTDPLFVNPPARLYSIGGARAEHRGSVKFSTVDLFGKELSRTRFIVTNEEKFKMWAATYLEAMFRAKNADPDRHLAAAFTHYMHDANLHWSGCTEGK